MAMHGIDVRSDVVVKRFRSVDRDQPRREWRALELLDRYAPGLAPAPVSADLDADPPTVVMSRLRGEPVHGPITGRLADAIAEAVTRVQRALPESVLRRLLARPATPVFGTGDGNLANYLWDGTAIRVLDFEYSGRSDLL